MQCNHFSEATKISSAHECFSFLLLWLIDCATRSKWGPCVACSARVIPSREPGKEQRHRTIVLELLSHYMRATPWSYLGSYVMWSQRCETQRHGAITGFLLWTLLWVRLLMCQTGNSWARCTRHWTGAGKPCWTPAERLLSPRASHTSTWESRAAIHMLLSRTFLRLCQPT